MLFRPTPIVKRIMSSLQQVPINPLPPLILIDFDQTITKKDTIGLLGEFGVAQTNIPNPWSYFVDSYLEDYRKHRDHLPDLPKDASFRAFTQQLDSYKTVEKASLARVSKHKVFKGISRTAFTEEGKRLRESILQPHVISVLKKYKEDIRIISLNWSKDWILGFIQELELRREQIYSNDLKFTAENISTGEIVPHILTASDKQQIITSSVVKPNQKVIYIGDSLGDIEALVSSDIGIIIGRDTSLLQPLQKYGYKVQNDTSLPSSLYQVDTWDQIKTILEKQFSNT